MIEHDYRLAVLVIVCAFFMVRWAMTYWKH